MIRQCWNMFSPSGDSIEGTWNRNIKIMFDLPYPTHRNLLPPISNSPNIKMILGQRYLKFISTLKTSKKPVLRQLIRIVENDSRTTTGHNLRNFLMMTKLARVKEMTPSTILSMDDYVLPESQTWKLKVVDEALKMRSGEIELPDGLTMKEMEVFLESACVD